MSDTRRRAAEMLIVGFAKALMVRNVAAMAGYDPDDPDSVQKMSEECPFLAVNKYEIHRPIRAFVVSNWPKLADFLTKHEGDSAKLLSVVDQVVRLKRKPGEKSARLLRKEDYAEAMATRRQLAAASFSYGASRDAFKTHQRSAWNVCK